MWSWMQTGNKAYTGYPGYIGLFHDEVIVIFVISIRYKLSKWCHDVKSSYRNAGPALIIYNMK